MKILLLGKNGQVGWELQRSLTPLGEVIALDRHSTEWCGDLTDLPGLAATVKVLRPDVIVNAAAYTAVDKAESEAELAHTINSLAPAVLAQEAKKLGAWLVHYSSDYVFDGSGDRSWTETDSPAPLNVYGQTKLEGEQGIAASGCAHLIFRTSWVHSSRGENFIKTILRLAPERDWLSVVNDQIGAPTSACLIAYITGHALRAVARPGGGMQFGGLYHLAAEGEVSWHGYAQWIIRHTERLGAQFALKSADIHPVVSAGFPKIAKRPLNSRLNSEKLKNVFGLTLPGWQAGVDETLEKILCLPSNGGVNQ
jgi:dTDP-4-dehydrorhamnose reductase